MDASAAIKGVKDDSHSEALRHWLHEARTANASLVAPYLLRYELGQALARETRMEAALRAQVLEHLLLAFVFADGDGAEAFAPPLTFYDAAYLSLARSTGAALVTYDEVLAKAARKAGIETLAPR